MTAPDGNEEAPAPAEHAQAGLSDRRGWLRRNYPLLLILVVPAAIGLFFYAIARVRTLAPPAPAELAYWTAQRFVAEGHDVEALYHLDLALDSDPGRLDAALLASRLRLGAGDRELGRIRTDLERRLEDTSPEDGGRGALHALLALICRASDPRSAAEHEARAAELRPESAAACYYRSLAAADPDEAFRWLEKGLSSFDSNHVPSLKASALALHRLGRFDEMNIVLQRADEKRSGDAATLFLVALALRSVGDPDAALAVHETILRLRPRDPEAYRQRSLTHVLRRDLGKATMDAREAVALAAPALRDFYRAQLERILAASGQAGDAAR